MGVFVSRLAWKLMTSASSSGVGVKVRRHWGVTLMGESLSCSEMQPTQRALQVRELGRGASKRPRAKLRAAGQSYFMTQSSRMWPTSRFPGNRRSRARTFFSMRERGM